MLKADIQAQQYSFPYHYIPQYDEEGFWQSRRWGFALSYVTALSLIDRILQPLIGGSHLDVGCGDGALVNWLADRHPDLELHGIDLDARAIAWARQFGRDNAEFHCTDLVARGLGRTFASASMVEVLEHVPPVEIPDFLAAVAAHLSDEGTLVLTVPHVNKRVSEKHFQHFSRDSLARTLSPHFTIEYWCGFERLGLLEKAYFRLLQNRQVFAESRSFNAFLLNRQLSRAHSDHEDGCGRILAVCRKA